MLHPHKPWADAFGTRDWHMPLPGIGVGGSSSTRSSGSTVGLAEPQRLLPGDQCSVTAIDGKAANTVGVIGGAGRKIAVVDTNHRSNWCDADPRRRRFVVPCPVCAEEDYRPDGVGSRAMVLCSLCDGFGRVPRTVAEQYLLAEHGPIAA